MSSAKRTAARKRVKARAVRPAPNPSGYSGTPLWRKLGLKSGQSAAYVRAPSEFGALLHGAPDDVDVVTRGSGALDLIVLFVKKESELAADFVRYAKRLQPAGMLWVAWPKKQSGVATDLTFDPVQRTGLAAGLVDVKVCAIDATWSGLKFVRRLADRGSPASKPGRGMPESKPARGVRSSKPARGLPASKSARRSS
jgi:hypothetical protein